MRRTTIVTLVLAIVGMILFAGLLLAGVGILVAFGALLVLWLAAIVLARPRSTALARQLVQAFPFVLVAAIVVWLAIIYGGAGG